MTIERHNNLMQAEISKKKTNKIMTEFLTNIKEQESD